MSANSPPTAHHPRRWSRLMLAGLGVLLSLGTVEGTLQLSVLAGTPPRLADPGAYAHPLCDTWYWRTRAQQNPGPHTEATHPRFGWTADGAGTEPPVATAYRNSVVLLGDSFLAGTTEVEARIPALLRTKIAARQVESHVEDLSVGGYGLDQILLRLQDRVPTLSPGTPVVIGVLTTDIDRTVLTERDSPKPHFVLSQNGELVLETDHLHHGIPAPDKKLLTWARWKRFWAGQKARQAGLPHDDCRVAEKRALATAMFTSLTTICTEAQLQCLVVPFLRAEDLARTPGWREQLIESATNTVQQLRLRPLLNEPEASLYGPDRHPTAHQNRIVASAIDRWLSETAAGSTTQ